MRAKSTEEVQRIVEIARKNGYGVMPIGNLTSAIGSFEGQKNADLHGLKGFIGIQIQSNGQLESEENETSFVQIDGNSFKVIKIETGELAGKVEILKSQNPKINHRVRAWAGITPGQINEVLQQELGFGHSVYLDLTSFNQAQIGAVVANGSQGPVRASAKNNLQELVIVDGKGEKKNLRGDEAKMQVGLSGSAGAITEVTLDVIREGKNEFGFFIPFPEDSGGQHDGLTGHMPRVMTALDPLCRGEFIDDEKGRKLVCKHSPVLLKGFEIITYEELKDTYAHLSEDSPERGRIGGILENMQDSGSHVGLLINATTDLKEDQINDLITLFLRMMKILQILLVR